MSVEILKKYFPERAVEVCWELIRQHHIHLKIVNERKTRHGDYRKLSHGGHQITINANRNPYAFLLTFIHELAHLIAFEQYGSHIKPHGKEWKFIFQKLMFPLLNETIFPEKLLRILVVHFQNPKASSDTDTQLYLTLKEFDPPSSKSYVFELLEGERFRLCDGRIFIRGKKQIKRYLCQEERTGKWFLFQPHFQVESI